MQPLAYFAVRSLLGWLQLLERNHRAFSSGPLLLVATGAAHCWAVVYSLFIAIHIKAMRYEGYHEEYTEHLPWWVSWTETLSIAAMAVWWIAGFVTAALRIVDDDGLPTEWQDVAGGIFVKLARSTLLQVLLAAAHTISCAGLFGSILLLCGTMAMMKGGVTVCELALILVAVGFSIPHVVVAVKRIFARHPKKEDFESPRAISAHLEAAAAEAASIGPQLCVVLALADSPGHAYQWQKATYGAAAGIFITAVLLAGQFPRKVGSTALPPDVPEIFTGFALDAMASVCLVICFPHLNCWQIWAMFGLLALIFLAITFQAWRELIVELLEPIFVVRSDTDKVLPGKHRDLVRRLSWVAAIAAASAACWDIMLHPLEVPLDPPDLHLQHGLPLIWDRDSMLLMRWHEDAPSHGERKLLDIAADAMNLPYDGVAPQAYFPEHRLFIFRITRRDYKGRTDAHEEWRKAWVDPQGKLAEIAEVSFPHNLNVTLCMHHDESAELARKQAAQLREEFDDVPDFDPELSETVPEEESARDAYMKACQWWQHEVDEFYARDDHDWGPLGNDELEMKLDEVEDELREFRQKW
eukprot:CAMPEP_0206447528 /NCGR_PEP_ID=MMETSP0324_2-20121206/16864_1 /ASSEMBLY_ACC=CAM_ASM_000836 /TAXON_ID=2866 /ORGANISM="Crypthecodinium cohnii, Strain Seligo" /LENGTH=581 /DNA_ID=CAMNT_0053916365 /DNA_START=81 /DNA_END=1823 /DNA_ORIENTATION=-